MLHSPSRWLALLLASRAVAEAASNFGSHAAANPSIPNQCVEDQITLLQERAVSKPGYGKQLSIDDGKASSEDIWPVNYFRASFAALGSRSSVLNDRILSEQMAALGVIVFVLVMALVGLQRLFPTSTALKALILGFTYICASAGMIESNKWLMLPGHFPYPLSLTMNHMLTSWVLANILRFFCPSAFPSLQHVEVTWWFRLKFLPIGAAFAISIVCGNAAYKFLSVSFLQIMKQSNIVVIYTFSVLCSLEALRRCSVILLFITLCGSLLAVHGELHFHIVGFVLQLISSLSEAAKVIIQGILMSGSYKLDPMTMVLFMAPACLFANTIPFFVLEGTRITEIFSQMLTVLPCLGVNAVMAFILNLLVAQCIKQLSPVGYLLCGIVKDVSIIVSSSWFLGESLALQQIVGFALALTGVASYSMYKQNQDCFGDDLLLPGFAKVAKRILSIPDSIKDVKDVKLEGKVVAQPVNSS